MIRFCESKIPYEGDDVEKDECLVLNQSIWEKGRAYFAKHKDGTVFSVSTNTGRCYAWQDQEAKREIRMLREMEEQGNAIGFHDLYPHYTEVTIHGCNELAWYMRKYLMKRGIPVNVTGRFWKELGIEEGKSEVPGSQNYEIWAEGVHQKSGDWKQERLRSASVEFECVDKIYEANIKAGRIKDCSMELGEFLEKLRHEEQIVIRGTGTMAQDTYDWLLSNGVDICAFQSGRPERRRKRLFGKPVLKKEEVVGQFEHAVILECGAQNSAWGFGDVDAYDYEGYERNKRYFLVKDYINVPGNNLIHVLEGKRLILTGDIRLCNRVYRCCKQHGTGSIVYWNVLQEDETEVGKFQVPVVSEIELSDGCLVMLVLPQYSYENYLLEEAIKKKNSYVEKFNEYGIDDWSGYFSDLKKCIYLESDNQKFNKKKLCPRGILLGIISSHSGNVLVKQSLSDHPQIILMQESSLLCDELYYICIRLAEDSADDILADFWALYHGEIEQGWCFSSFYDGDKEKFNQKMKQLLAMGETFTSQELFVMFHLAYEAMYGREIQSLENKIIYWEPHMWNREYLRDWAYWFDSSDVSCFMLNVVRNSYACAGSKLKYVTDIEWQGRMNCIFNQKLKKREMFDSEYECTVRFEDLKCNPKEMLTELCDWMGICFEESLMETTVHGEKAFYEGKITGFDPSPAYKLYEEFFSIFDRMRICLINSSFQKENEYPYVSSLHFSRRQLQEMFLKAFRWEGLQKTLEGKTEENIYNVQKKIRGHLWRERFIEIMEIE